MKQLLDLITNNPSTKELSSHNKELSCFSMIEEVMIVAASFYQKPRNIVVIKENAYQAQQFHQKITPLLKAQSVLFDVEESLRVQAITNDIEGSARRIEALSRLTKEEFKVCITHIGALSTHRMNVNQFKESLISLKVNQEISIQQLKEAIQEAGYAYVSRVEKPLCFAYRGGILDVFSVNYPHPIRIEFFDNEIESIRFFDSSTQRTINTIDQVELLCASEFLFNEQQYTLLKEKTNQEFIAHQQKNPELASALQDTLSLDLDFIHHHLYEARLYPYVSYLEDTSSLLDYIDQPHIIYSNKEKGQDHLKRMHEESIIYIQEMIQEGILLPHFAIYKDEASEISKYPTTIINPYLNIKSTIREVSLPTEPIQILVDLFIKQSKENVIILSLSSLEQSILNPLFTEKNVLVEEFQQPAKSGIFYLKEELEEGFELINDKIFVYTSKECFKKKRKTSRYISKFNQAEALSSYQELNSKDYIVHHQHGVGQFIKIQTKEINGIHKDFLQILFKGNDELLVPLEQFNLVRKFVSREGVTPKLNKLGSSEWAKTKAKIKANVQDIAERLINLYSSREEHIGFAFSEDNEDIELFNQDFEHELTPDQSVAIEQIKKDMISAKPMDRLLCGDVGFGKTEVSIRAAFRAVNDQKQVAFLCPTTILSLQHYQTFVNRFKKFAVNIAVINRFISPAKQSKIIKDLKEGKIDILIGTHRILSKDVVFKDLGLLIIDEEQRFGVEHKEKIKELKQSIDVLSLSATPIPRTLQMSLIGVRQLSLLETPPNNRYPVQTYVVEKNKNLIVDVIQKELSRQGQVFYLFNNIDQIYNVARTLQVQLPDAKIAVAHGKMSREEIEEVMYYFSNGEYNILICTTIIETGIDIPNANTILVENANRFGLSQLYQIKGRVGRSDRVAYAYLLVNEFKQLSEIATKRLQSIKEFSELGSGYKIAMRDLTIRGAGDLLGPNQSGFIDAVGIDYYIEMLQEAINEKKGIVVQTPKENIVKPQIAIDGYIPEEFSPQDLEKIAMYQSIEKIKTLEELTAFTEEIKDYHGKFPTAVRLLFEKKQLEIVMSDNDVEQFKESKTGAEIIFSEVFSNQLDGVKLFDMVNSISKSIKIKYAKNKINITLPKHKNILTMAITVIQGTKDCISNKF